MTHIATRFSDLNLSRHIATALEKIGYETPTPIQQQAIPEILLGRDIQGIAQTGTGKTAAFSLPILSLIADNPIDAPKRSTRVLVLSPTRELASQIGENVKNYARHIEGFKSTVIFGGTPISKQVKKVVPGNDVIVATPGRLLDLIQQKILNLSAVEFLILDEADQMMDMGFIHTLRKIIPLLPKKRQTLFFSATMPKSISQLAAQFLTNPVKIAVTPESTTAERVEQSITYATRTEKPNLLALNLLNPAVERALVFTRTKHGADRVVKRLATIGLDSRAIHGNKSQAQRTRALKAFKDGEVKFLIATDVAARGIDIRGVSHVFNFEIPNVPEQYIHRIGRTGRAGEAGIAISFVAPDEKQYLRDIQKILKQTLEVKPIPEDFSEQSQALKKRPALVRAPEPERPARRQKDRTSRPSRHRKGPSKDVALSDDNALDQTSGRPPKKTDPNKPSRAERKRTKSGLPRKPRNGEESGSKGRSSYKGKPSRDDSERSGSRSGGSVRRKSGTHSHNDDGPAKPRRREDSSGDFKPRSKDFNGNGKGRKAPYNPDETRSDKPRSQNKTSNFKRKPRPKSDERSGAARPRFDEAQSQGDRPVKPRSKPSAKPQQNSRGEARGSDRNKAPNKGQNKSQNKSQGGGWSSPKRRTTSNNNRNK